jgi:hypothetical protein
VARSAGEDDHPEFVVCIETVSLEPLEVVCALETGGLVNVYLKDHARAEGLITATSPAEDARAEGRRARRSLGIGDAGGTKVICSHTVVFHEPEGAAVVVEVAVACQKFDAHRWARASSLFSETETNTIALLLRE